MLSRLLSPAAVQNACIAVPIHLGEPLTNSELRRAVFEVPYASLLALRNWHLSQFSHKGTLVLCDRVVYCQPPYVC